MTRLASLLVVCLAAAGCARQAPEYRGRPRVHSAQLVAVNPDVKTVADSDQPLFFSRGFFWLFHDGGWWRAERATSDVWVRVYDPPVPVKQILNPFAYTNFQDDGSRTASRETAAPSPLQRELARPTKRDHRTDPTPAAPVTPSERSTDPSDPATTDSPKL